MKIYEVITIEESKQVIKATDGEQILWIPTDPANSDYQEYLASLEEDLV
jgi:hypothetical protein